MRIDSHQHFWKYDSADYGWIPAGSKIHGDFGPAELEPLLTSAKIDGCISVQARQSLRENEYLCGLAETNPFIRGVVGWIDLRSKDVDQQAKQFKSMPKAVGVRHVVQDETDPHFMARDPFRRGIACLAKHELVYDILIFEQQMHDAIELVKAFPDQTFVLDHIAKPKIKKGDIREWSTRITEISHYSNVSVKLSGVLTEADHQHWKLAELSPYWEAVAQAFGPERILFGSDWPVLRLAADYHQWVEIVDRWLERFSDSERKQIWGENAARVYGLG